MNWLTLFQPVYSTIASLVIGFLIGRIRKIKDESKAERQALGALLRNDMYSIYRKYRDADEVPVEVQEEMHSLGEAYHNLGFNATGTKIHDEIMAKPTKV
jgi:hypothetical protein